MAQGRLAAAVVACLAALLAAPGGAVAVTRFVSVTDSNRVVSFNSDSPGAIRTAARMGGFVDAEERIAGIDLRPATGGLYAVGTASRLYRLDARTGTLTAVRPDLLDVFLRGYSVGFDFDPVGGAVRIVNEADQNMRVNPDSGQTVDRIPSSPVLDPDVDLAYAAGDRYAGDSPDVTAIAYTPAGRLYGLDTARDTLVAVDSPESGVLRTVGALGVDVADPTGFDIGPDGEAWAAFRRAGKTTPGLWRIDLASGRAFRPRRDNAIGSAIRNRVDDVRGLAVAGSARADRRPPRFALRVRRAPSVGALGRGRGLALTGSCDEACTLTARLRLGRRTLGSRAVAIRDVGGRARFTLRASRRGRALLRRARGGRLRLSGSARDAAGNVSRR